MKTIQVSDQIYDKLKQFVVDPFDDTPDTVLNRIIDIANKAKSRWNPFLPETEDELDELQSVDDDEKVMAL